MCGPAAKAFKAFEIDKPSPTENDSTMSPVVNKDIDNKSMTDKLREKIKQITKTPPATPLVSRLQISPEPSALKRPISILKSNKKQSRITPAETMEPGVNEPFPASSRKRSVSKTPSRESYMEAPEVGRRKSPSRKSSISVEQVKPMEPVKTLFLFLFLVLSSFIIILLFSRCLN
uniref:Uncharacterized protein n=1 Tax=Panagrolaimus davidi TaxID=227884 RepID=A0A914R158_9BILA